jgi:hypothetical protein
LSACGYAIASSQIEQSLRRYNTVGIRVEHVRTHRLDRSGVGGQAIGYEEGEVKREHFPKPVAKFADMGDECCVKRELTGATGFASARALAEPVAPNLSSRY